MPIILNLMGENKEELLDKEISDKNPSKEEKLEAISKEWLEVTFSWLNNSTLAITVYR